MAVNRWLPPNSPMNSGMGSSVGWKVGMLIVGILTFLAASASAFFVGRPFITSVLDTPEREQRREDELRHRDEQIRRLREENQHSNDRFTDKITDLDHRVTDLQRENQRRDEEAKHQQEIAELKDRHARELSQLQRAAERERQAAELERQRRRTEDVDRSATPRDESPSVRFESNTPTVFVREDPYRYEFRVMMRGIWHETDRPYYRERFSKGCNVPPSMILDIPHGFVIASDGCRRSTFEGFEFIQTPESAVGSVPGVR